ncbi:hypothetical protein HYU07_06400 [Candidatus Woesearchaeota archaeon]|nr:hypothetical protein [Candidatus Woesearchaeota archaeon]
MRLLGILGLRESTAKNKPEEEKYSRAMEVAELIIDSYPEIDRTKRDVWDHGKDDRKIVNKDGSVTYLGWNDDAVVCISKNSSSWYGIDCHIMARDKKERNNWDRYSISATIDYRGVNQNFIEEELRKSGVSDKRNLGHIDIDVYKLGQNEFGMYDVEGRALMDLLHVTLAREIAPKYGIKMKIGGGCCGNKERVEFSVHNLQENNINNLVEAVKRYNFLISLPEFKNIKEANLQRIESELRDLAIISKNHHSAH